MWIIATIISFVIIYFISASNSEKKQLNDRPFGTHFKILVDELGNRLWKGEKFILMKKDTREFYIQKSITLSKISYVQIIYKPSTLHLTYYANFMDIETKYSQSYTYNIENLTSDVQKRIAEDFSKNVSVNSKVDFK
ncbi:MAG: hypothetical protein ACWIPI_08260 [Polaribacter sp.]